MTILTPSRAQLQSASAPCLAKAVIATAGILASLLLAAIPSQLSAAGPAPVDLGTTKDFVILSGAAITTTGGGAITGDVGASPIAGSAIGVDCAQVNGTVYAVDASGPPCAVIDATFLTVAKGDLTIAYNDAAGRSPTPTGPFLNPGLTPGSGDIGGMVLAPGLYKFTTTAMISGSDVTLTGAADDVWIFQCAQDLQLASGIKVILAGGAQAKNVFWQVGTSAVLGTSSVFKGTILADQAITMQTSSTLEGRALAFEAGVTFNGSGAILSTAPEIAVEQPVGVNVLDGGIKDFGVVLVNADKDLTFSILNSGEADLNLTLPIAFTGADAALFSVTTPPDSLVLPGDSTTFTVRFSPLTAGIKDAALEFANNDSDESPFNINLTGEASAITVPEIVVEQPLGNNVADGGSKDFGPVFPGDSKDLTFTITNSGSADLTLVDPTFIDPIQAPLDGFSVVVLPTSPVLPGGTTTFTVRFSPPIAGGPAFAAVLEFANNDSDEDPYEINLTGERSAVPVPEILVEQPVGTNIADGGAQSFGSVLVGGSKDLTFTIGNSGSSGLTLTPPALTGPDAGLFTVTNFPAPTVASDATTTFTVRFAPLDVGAKVATLQFGNNDSDENPYTINLTGTGLAVVSASPIVLNPQTGLFEQTVIFINSGSVALDAVRLNIQDLPLDVQVYNASGSTGGIPFIQHNFPVAAGAGITFIVEYYRATRLPIPQPTFTEAAMATPPVVVGTDFAINSFQMTGDGRFLIEFTTVLGRTYAVQYKSDMSGDWKTVSPSITAPANLVQWYDDGPPKTESKPSSVDSRFYRVIELP